MNKTTLYTLIALILIAAGAYLLWGNRLQQGQNMVPPQENATSTAATSTDTGAPATGVEGESVTLTGTIVCLPHKGNGEVQTMECAFGLKTDDGKYYGISGLSDIAANGVNPGIDTGVRVRIEGTIDTTTAAKSNYNILGTINAITAEKLSK